MGGGRGELRRAPILMWPSKSNIFIIWPFAEKSAYSFPEDLITKCLDLITGYLVSCVLFCSQNTFSRLLDNRYLLVF